MNFSTSAGWPSNFERGRAFLGLAHVNHRQLQRQADLLRRQADAVVRVHRLEHAGDEPFDFRRDFFNRRAFLPQHRMAVFDNS